MWLGMRAALLEAFKSGVAMEVAHDEEEVLTEEEQPELGLLQECGCPGKSSSGQSCSELKLPQEE
jgi:hypothetical protein